MKRLVVFLFFITEEDNFSLIARKIKKYNYWDLNLVSNVGSPACDNNFRVIKE